MMKLDANILPETGVSAKAFETIRNLAVFNMWNTDSMTWYDCETNVLWYDPMHPDYVW